MFLRHFFLRLWHCLLADGSYMGHKLLDIDSFGAAMGIWRIAVSMNKRANVVMSDVSSSVKPMMDRFLGGEYPDDLFISEEQAMTN